MEGGGTSEVLIIVPFGEDGLVPLETKYLPHDELRISLPPSKFLSYASD